MVVMWNSNNVKRVPGPALPMSTRRYVVQLQEPIRTSSVIVPRIVRHSVQLDQHASPFPASDGLRFGYATPHRPGHLLLLTNTAQRQALLGNPSPAPDYSLVGAVVASLAPDPNR
jgi:hypothetical protein